MFKHYHFYLIISSLLLSCPIQAKTNIDLYQPHNFPQDPRIKQVEYQPHNVVTLHFTNLDNTQIIFSNSESIVDIETGDMGAWSIYVNPNLGNILNIKPTLLGSSTDMQIITITNEHKRRYYFFEIDSVNKITTDKKDKTYAVEFIYPEAERNKLQKQLKYQHLAQNASINNANSPQTYNWDYSFHGDKSIMPIRVFDDGHFTYMQWRPQQTLPAIFLVNNSKGEEAVVNFRHQDPYIVIHRIAPQWTLRHGKNHVASIFNHPMIVHAKQKC